jgi:hypothetical protein
MFLDWCIHLMKQYSPRDAILSTLPWRVCSAPRGQLCLRRLQAMAFRMAVASLAVISVMAQDPGPDLLYAEAVRELTAMRKTNYSHTTQVNESAGQFTYDCSGFVTYALKIVSLPASAAVPKGSRTRPAAEDFTVRPPLLVSHPPPNTRVNTFCPNRPVFT